MSRQPGPNVCTIPASVPFLPALIDALVGGRLIDGFKPNPLALADVTLYLPTRRACRMARAGFLGVVAADAAILPRIVALGDIDEDEFIFADTALDLPPALEGLERRMLLAQLVLKWAEQVGGAIAGGPPLIVNTPASALALADELARLMDDMATREVPWDALDTLVPDQYDAYWQITLRFLQIARDTWPRLLAERGAIDPATRRDRLIDAEAKRLAADRSGPVIAAGSTGSMPSTAKLIATIAALPHGAVVLPGLDTELDEESWQAIASADGAAAPGHPQFAMHGLLQRIGIARHQVRTLALAAPHGRELLVSEALRPAATTDRWQARLRDVADRLAAALQSVRVVEAANAEEESLAIAIALREAVADGRSAALVTPDRALARRVTAALARWAIVPQDSAGTPLADTPAGIFARLTATAVLGGLAPIDLLALLKHPLFRLGAADRTHAAAIAALECAVLRGPRPRPGGDGLSHALANIRAEIAKARRGEVSELHRADPRLAIDDAALDAATALTARLGAAVAPFERLGRAKALPFAAFVAAHADAVATLAGDAAETVAAYAGPDGNALEQAFGEIAARAGAIMVAPADYAELFAASLAGRVVRAPVQNDARVQIYGLLEARLTSCDRVVLGGLVEGVWPPEVRTDPWLSRPMRQQLGLDLPERRIGLSAHDFAQMMGAPEVILTRAGKLAGAPTVASRFLQRFAAVAGEAQWQAACARGADYLHWARALDHPAQVTPAPRPEPRPPRPARPTSLSVTEIEHWLRDPYTIYAKHILRLAPLDPIDMAPGGSERGSAIHNAIAEFGRSFAEALPDDAEAELLRIGRRHFAPLEDYPEARAFWWPRFTRIARWYAGWERRRRAKVARLFVEQAGEITIPIGQRQFRLRTRADRLEQLADGRYAILDYKTGRVPGNNEVKVGLAPQLALEAAILRQGGFTAIARGASVAELVYVALKGGTPGDEECVVKLKDTTADAVADDALRNLQDLATRFEDDTEPYRSLLLPMWKTRYGDYDHLARVKEWSLAGDDGDGA